MAGTEERARVLQLFVRRIRVASEVLSFCAALMKKQVLRSAQDDKIIEGR